MPGEPKAMALLLRSNFCTHLLGERATGHSCRVSVVRLRVRVRVRARMGRWWGAAWGRGPAYMCTAGHQSSSSLVTGRQQAVTASEVAPG